MQERYWMGTVPTRDDFGAAITTSFIDGRTFGGPWATMSPVSHQAHGVGLGLGKGQRYEKQPGGRWLKVEG